MKHYQKLFIIRLIPLCVGSCPKNCFKTKGYFMNIFSREHVHILKYFILTRFNNAMAFDADATRRL